MLLLIHYQLAKTFMKIKTMGFEVKAWWMHVGCFRARYEFYWRQWVNTHLTAEVSLSFRCKAGAKVAYLEGRHLLIRINFQILIVICSMKYENYSYFKIAKTFLIDQINPNQLDGNVWDYSFNVYPRWGKVYELLGVEPRGSKFINRRCINFSDSN